VPKEAYALIGAVLGALLAGLRSWWLEVRREKKAAKAAQTLIAIELRNALEAVYVVRRDEAWPIGWSRTWTESWGAAREKLLARPPSEDTTRAVASAASRLDQLQNAVNKGRDDRKLNAEDKIFLWDMQQLLEDACAALNQTRPEGRPEDPTEDEPKSSHESPAAPPAGEDA